MNLEFLFSLYYNSFVFAPARFIWWLTHAFSITDNFVGHILSFLLIIPVYCLFVYVVWCFICGVLDILIYNKRRTKELLQMQEQKKADTEAYEKWKAQAVLGNGCGGKLDINNKEHMKMFAEAMGVSPKQMKKMMKKM